MSARYRYVPPICCGCLTCNCVPIFHFNVVAPMPRFSALAAMQSTYRLTHGNAVTMLQYTRQNVLFVCALPIWWSENYVWGKKMYIIKKSWRLGFIYGILRRIWWRVRLLENGIEGATNLYLYFATNIMRSSYLSKRKRKRCY